MEYKPTHKDRCEDTDCKSYGKPLVDRGYGYPVCETQKWRHERYPGSEDEPMNPRYLETKNMTTTENRNTDTSTDREDEIIYKSDDLIEFGEFDGLNDGSYRIQVHRNAPDTEGDREIYSGIDSFDADGNKDGNWIEDCPDYVRTAKRIWEAV